MYELKILSHLQTAKRKVDERESIDAEGRSEPKKRKKTNTLPTMDAPKGDAAKCADELAPSCVTEKEQFDIETVQSKTVRVENFLASDYDFQTDDEIPLNSSVVIDAETAENNRITLETLFGNSHSDEEIQNAPSPIHEKRNLRNRKI